MLNGTLFGCTVGNLPPDPATLVAVSGVAAELRHEGKAGLYLYYIVSKGQRQKVSFLEHAGRYRLKELINKKIDARVTPYSKKIWELSADGRLIHSFDQMVANRRGLVNLSFGLALVGLVYTLLIALFALCIPKLRDEL